MKYLRHTNSFPATYLVGKTSLTVKPGEMLVYSYMVNDNINSADYNLDLWNNYITTNNFSIINIPDGQPLVVQQPPAQFQVLLCTGHKFIKYRHIYLTY